MTANTAIQYVNKLNNRKWGGEVEGMAAQFLASCNYNEPLTLKKLLTLSSSSAHSTKFYLSMIVSDIPLIGCLLSARYI